MLSHISYTYDFERLHEVLYPENLFNRVTYTYGKAGDLHKLEKLQSRRTPNMKLIRNAKSAMREARALYETLVSFTTGVETVKKEVGKKVQSQLPKDYGGQ